MMLPRWAFTPREKLLQQGVAATSHGLRAQWMIYAKAHKKLPTGELRVQEWHEHQRSAS